MSDAVKVRFALQKEQDGWPPAESEGLWAEPLGDDLYRLDNTPWFVRGVAAGALWFSHVRERGGRMVVRVIPREDGPIHGDRLAILEALSPLGVGAEGTSTPVTMVALDIGPDAPLSSLKALLIAGERDGRWYYEEGCVTKAWSRLP